jgi:hypothetical protein
MEKMINTTDFNFAVVGNLGFIPKEEHHTQESKVICNDILYMVENLSLDKADGILQTEDSKKLILAHAKAFVEFLEKL